ncbi:MAG: hypothetical protein HYZ28_06975 [Myxococcales bacterium]|nr:hypothetical protein [Myxococcales bacterium]
MRQNAVAVWVALVASIGLARADELDGGVGSRVEPYVPRPNVDPDSWARRRRIRGLEDPTRTRYLYGPSAFMLKQGEVHFSQKELFFSSVGVGVSDHLSLQAESVLPALLLGVDGLNAIVAVKGGLPVCDTLHLAAGAQALLLMRDFGSPLVVGFVFSPRR